ncbi:MAG: shikimate kinase [Candidatus Limnocylindria bacterium]
MPNGRVEARRVLLVGMMGSGKSTIGRLLADATGWPYLDNDELVRRSEGALAREIATDDGEGRLREVESAALAVGLREPAPCIVGVAAGTVLDPGNRRRMAAGAVVIWLDADPSVLAVRASGSAHRPWLEGDAEDWLRRTGRDRESLYREVADIRIDTGASDVIETRDAILAWMRTGDCAVPDPGHDPEQEKAP